MKNGSNALPRKLACWPGVTLPSRRTCGIGDERGDRRIVGRLEPGDRAAVGRIELLGVAEPDVVERRSVAGQAVIGRRVVVLHPVVDRAHLREPVDHRGEPRQMLGDRQARLAGRDRLELAANARAGASGFMSNVSRCDGPPNWCRKMMCLARAAELGACSALKQRGRLKPAMPAVPAWSSRRRESRQPS